MRQRSTIQRPTAKTIAKALNQKEADLAKQLAAAKADSRRFVPIAKGLDEETATEIKSDAGRHLDPKGRPSAVCRAALEGRTKAKLSVSNACLARDRFQQRRGRGQAGIEQSQNDDIVSARCHKTSGTRPPGTRIRRNGF